MIYNVQLLRFASIPLFIGILRWSSPLIHYIQSVLSPLNLWNQAKENSKGKDRMSVELNHYLEITRSRIHQIYRELETSDKVINVDLVRKLF